jgi:hypothetical protein
MSRKILALKFQLESNSGIVELIAWILEDGNGKFLKPVKADRTLMDVRKGDTVCFNGEMYYRVRRLKPWRASDCKAEQDYPEITCGRDWEAESVDS